jgi:glycosylphosphatidylinositol transamidase (GPIT) subunit GPI8
MFVLRLFFGEIFANSKHEKSNAQESKVNQQSYHQTPNARSRLLDKNTNEHSNKNCCGDGKKMFIELLEKFFQGRVPFAFACD